MITGFLATVAVDDGGTGAASGGTSTVFDGVTEFEFPEMAAQKFEATELAQTDAFEREEPTGTIKVSETSAVMKYTKANYQRLVALNGKRGYTFKLTSPDDLSGGGTPVKLIDTFVGFISKVGKLKVQKGQPMLIPFEITSSRAPAFT